MWSLFFRISRPESSLFWYRVNLVPRASFPLTSGRETRALGATISGMRHRCRCAVSRITRIRLFLLFFHNGCSQSSRFPTAGQGERSSGNEIGIAYKFHSCALRFSRVPQLVEHRTGIAEVTGSNPVDLIFFRLLLSNGLDWKLYCDYYSLHSNSSL